MIMGILCQLSVMIGLIVIYLPLKPREMKRIITVQDLIDELMLVNNKDVEINIRTNDGVFRNTYTPNLYDFTVIDSTNVSSGDEEEENRVIIEMYR